MYILQTCAGGISARPLTKEFEKLGFNVILGDMDVTPWAKTEQLCAKLPSPKNEQKYIEAIDEISKMYPNKNLAVYPHNHNEAIAISNALCEGEHDWISMISSPISISSTHDKKWLFLNLEKAGLPILNCRFFKKEELFGENTTFFCIGEDGKIIKPTCSCGGEGIIRTAKVHKEYIVMPDVSNWPEYTVDCVAYSGSVFTLCVRLRLKSHGGICVDCETLSSPPEEIVLTIQKFVKYFNLHGPLAIQGFYFSREKEFYITDCNHRFGGGAGMSIMAGWDGVNAYASLIKGTNFIRGHGIKNMRIRRWYTEEEINV